MYKLHTGIQLILLLAASGAIPGGVPPIAVLVFGVLLLNNRFLNSAKNVFNTLLTLLYKTAVRSSLFAK